jgi:hypothetical protein
MNLKTTTGTAHRHTDVASMIHDEALPSVKSNCPNVSE